MGSKFKMFKRFKSESGQGLTEYAVVLSLVAVLAIVSVSLFGGALKQRVAMLTGAVMGSTQVIEGVSSAVDSQTIINSAKSNKGMSLNDSREMVGAMGENTEQQPTH